MSENKNLPTTDTDAVDPKLDAWLRAGAIVDAINANLPEGSRKLLPIPKEYVFKKADREAVSAAFHAAFQLIGGVPGFALWAAEHQSQFYQLFAKLLPSETQTPLGNLQFNFISPVPETPQDRISIDAAGKVIEADTDEELPE